MQGFVILSDLENRGITSCLFLRNFWLLSLFRFILGVLSFSGWMKRGYPKFTLLVPGIVGIFIFLT